MLQESTFVLPVDAASFRLYMLLDFLHARLVRAHIGLPSLKRVSPVISYGNNESLFDVRGLLRFLSGLFLLGGNSIRNTGRRPGSPDGKNERLSGADEGNERGKSPLHRPDRQDRTERVLLNL